MLSKAFSISSVLCGTMQVIMLQVDDTVRSHLVGDMPTAQLPMKYGSNTHHEMCIL